MKMRTSYSVAVSQRSVLADDFFLDLSYDFDYSESTNKRYVYDAQDGSYDQLNDLLSNDFQVISRKHTPSFGLNYEGDIWRINTNFGLLHTSLEDSNFLQDSSFSNTYNDPFLRAEIRYELERSKSLSLRYRTDVDIPSIRQLQPVTRPYESAEYRGGKSRTQPHVPPKNQPELPQFRLFYPQRDLQLVQYEFY